MMSTMRRWFYLLVGFTHLLQLLKNNLIISA